MRAVSAVLLAAGESKRMGAVNKLMLPIGGVPLLRRSVLALLASELQEIIVVLGHDREDAHALIRDFGVTVVYNDNYQEGQMSSVHRGVGALVRDCEGIMICLADQPLLTTADVDGLIDAFLRGQPGSILVPTYQGRRGNPIVFAAEHRAAILAGERDLGCKRLIERNADLVTTLEMDNDHCVFDLDTPEDYAEWQRRARYVERGASGEAQGVDSSPD
jgi:molybdenum cofactor cytidylyltransferase